MDSKQHFRIAIIGAGPAGLMAAAAAYQPRLSIVILEKMPIPAIKLKLTGKGRCNLTNAAPLTEFINHFGQNGRFLKPAFKTFFNKDLLIFFETLGLRCKLERGGRYFPETDRAHDVANALLNHVKTLSIPILTGTNVVAIDPHPNGFELTGLVSGKNRKLASTRSLTAEKIVLATGGCSYPNTGSDGSGYRLATQLGHTIVPTVPSLVPLEVRRDFLPALNGLHLRHVSASLWHMSRKVAEQFGEMEFTDFGVAGPIILSLSRQAVPLLAQNESLNLRIDFKPALAHPKLDQRLQREISQNGLKGVDFLLARLLPRQVVPVMLSRWGIEPGKKLNQLSAWERQRLRLQLKEFDLVLTGYRSFDEAIITCGGVALNGIHSRTMESLVAPGFYLAGEVMDIDADTGGFNLQAAFSTGWLAGQSCRHSVCQLDQSSNSNPS